MREDLVLTAGALQDLEPAADELAAGQISENDFTDALQRQLTDPEVAAANERLTAAVAAECPSPPASVTVQDAFDTEMFCDRFRSAKYGEDHAEHAGPTAIEVVRTHAEAADWYDSISALVPADLAHEMTAITIFHERSASGQRVAAGVTEAGEQARRVLRAWLQQNCDLDYRVDEL